MTRHDYELLARAMRDCRPGSANALHQWREDCHAIADALTHDNPRNFNRDLFLHNSGVPNNVIF
jgi:hypothetical protein